MGSVWRGVKGVDLRSSFQKGAQIWWWAFSSTTKELSTLHNPMFLGTKGVRTVFMIEVLDAVDIVRYSIFEGEASEAEVLLFPGTKLQACRCALARTAKVAHTTPTSPASRVSPSSRPRSWPPAPAPKSCDGASR